MPETYAEVTNHVTKALNAFLRQGGKLISKWLIALLQADNIVNVVDVDSSSIVLSHRLTPLNTPPLEKGTPIYLTLQEILIIGNCHEQVQLGLGPRIACKFFVNIAVSYHLTEYQKIRKENAS